MDNQAAPDQGQVTIPRERMQEVDLLIMESTKPGFWKRGRFEHGFAKGVIAAIAAITGQKPQPVDLREGETYIEERTSGDFAADALDAMRESKHCTIMECQLRQKAVKMVEAWDANTIAASVQADLVVKSAAKLTLDGGLEFEFKSARDFWDNQVIQRFSRDRRHELFHQFATQAEFLMAVYNNNGSMDVRRVGVWSDPHNLLHFGPLQPTL